MSKSTITVPGSGTNIYNCSIDNGKYSCTCPQWVFRLSKQSGQVCKHIQYALDNQLFPVTQSTEIQRVPRAILLPLLEKAMGPIREIFDEYAICGSWRRGRATIKDVDIIVCIDKDGLQKTQLFDILYVKLTELGFERVKGSGQVIQRYHGYIGDPNYPDPIQFEISKVPFLSWGSGLCHYTGSMEENTRLREIALKKGYSLSQYGFKQILSTKPKVYGNLIPINTESGVYQFLDEPYKLPLDR